MMIFCSKQRILKSTEIPNVIINHIPIERVTYFKFLGVIIDSNLTWSHQINHISNKLSRICGVLSRLKHVSIFFINVKTEESQITSKTCF